MSSTPSQLTNLKTVVYRAGAGTGKTTTLVKEVIKLEAEFRRRHGRAPRIVMTTFTKKATQELKERLSVQAIANNNLELLKMLTEGRQILITTMHGVLSTFLRRNSHSFNLDSEFRIVDSHEHELFIRKAIRKEFRKDSKWTTILERHDFSQTLTLLKSAYVPIVSGRGPRAITVEDQQAAFHSELKGLGDLCLQIAQEILSSTEDPKWRECGDFLKHTGTEFAHVSQVSLSQLDEWRDKTLAVWEGFRKPAHRSGSPKVSDGINEALGECLKKLKALSEPQYTTAVWHQIAEASRLFFDFASIVVNDVVDAKIQAGVLAIEDLEALSLRLIRENPTPAQHFSEDWDYWFIDEYQDTSPTQVELLKYLVGNTPYFVVGDPQQSIYFFRGARSQVFHDKVTEIQSKGGDQFQLQINYRSRPLVLGFINHIFSKLPGFSSMEAGVATPDTSPHSLPSVSIYRLIDEGPGGDDESRAVVARIQSLLNNNVPLGDICVLGRTRDELHELAVLLEACNIPCHVQTSGGYYDRREVMDALNLLRFFVSPTDTKNLMGLLRAPWCRVSDETLVRLAPLPSAQSQSSLWANLVEFSEASPEHTDSGNIQRLNNWLQQCENHGVAQVFREALLDLGFFAYCHVHDVTGQRESNLWKLVQKLKEEEHQPQFNFYGFLRKMELGLDDPTQQNDSDAVAALEPTRVSLMTVHASKGLQFGHVIIPFLNARGRVSSSSSLCFNETQETLGLAIQNDESGWVYPLTTREVTQWRRREEDHERARVFYVALTRAKESLTLIQCGPVASGAWGEFLNVDMATGFHDLGPNLQYHIFDSVPESTQGDQLLRTIPEVRSPFQSTAGHKIDASSSLAIPFSVTGLVQQGKTSKQLTPIQALRVAHAGRRGVRVHKTLELIVKQNDRSGGELLNNAQARQTFISKFVRKNELDMVIEGIEFLLNLKDPPVHEIMGNGFSEWGFVMIHERVEIKGQIDLWGIVNNVLWIVDYKTGSPEDVESAFEQLEIYSDAVKAFCSDKKMAFDEIKCAAVYPLSKRYFLSSPLSPSGGKSISKPNPI